MKKYGYLLLVFQCLVFAGYAQQIVKGKVVTGEEETPLKGATIINLKDQKMVLSNENGDFSIKLENGSTQLEVRYIGYFTKRVNVKIPGQNDLLILLKPESQNLKNVTIVSTGYQRLPKERATGSYVQLANEALNKRVSPDIMSRLADITSGLIMNKNISAEKKSISIRGRSTLFANDQPLVVLNNFPYEGDLDQINPNDVETITVLKDAAAASIWGTRAGNGVIVITTKTGKYNQKPQFSFNSNLSITEKPDLFYVPKLSSADFIDREKVLFSQDFYKSDESSLTHVPFSPVVELLIAKRDGKVDKDKADAAIESYKKYDFRNDVEKYLYRKSINEQYALSMNGGTENNRYFLSVGYDKSLASLVGNSNDRISINGNSSYSFLNKKLELSTGLYFIKSGTTQKNTGESTIKIGTGIIYPYAQLIDQQGNEVPFPYDYRSSFIDQARDKGLLDWYYRPLWEIKMADRNISSVNYQFNTALKYKFFKELNGEVQYQYRNIRGEDRNHYGPDSYFARNLINRFTQESPDGTLNRIIPLGGILDLSNSNINSNLLRGQLNFNKDWNLRHQLNALAGYEIRELRSVSADSRLYGYDEVHETSKYVDYVNTFSNYYYPEGPKTRIPVNDLRKGLTDRNISYFLNGSYSYLSKYMLSFSARIDKSNLFGVKTNQKGVPLYSIGTSWNISREKFYHLNWMPEMKLRATFGYSGNIDKTLSALTTARYNNGAGTDNGLPYATIINPPNPELRWERVRMLNFGLDFSSKNNVFNGSIDYYRKQGLDLIGSAMMPGSTGINSFKGNTANTAVQGIDVVLNSRVLNESLKWNISLLGSYVTDRVTKYGIKATTNTYLDSGFSNSIPLEGKPLSALYSYAWGGLDPVTGDPQGYLDGVLSKDYNRIIQTATPESLIYHGSAKPVVFGALQQTLSYKGFSLNFNVAYRLGYYFRRNSVWFDGYLRGDAGVHGDFYKRWQQPGDESHTSVPSLPGIVNPNRDRLYVRSAALVERGDHIRLQDVHLSYNFPEIKSKGLPFTQMQIYAYANNLGLIWKANKSGLDPDYQSGPSPLMLSAGFKLGF